MWIRLVLLSLLSLPAAALADDFKIIKLEQDVRNLERQVLELSRQVGALQRRNPPIDVPVVPHGVETPASAGNPPWYSRANWEKVRAGMNELDVIRLLGTPTSVRNGPAEAKTLFYAVEIGIGAFLGGSIELKSHRVTVVNTPVLK